jgi:hypothetical protein
MQQNQIKLAIWEVFFFYTNCHDKFNLQSHHEQNHINKRIKGKNSSRTLSSNMKCKCQTKRFDRGLICYVRNIRCTQNHLYI